MAETFARWMGRWAGTKRLWLSPEADALESEISARMRSIGQDGFLQLNYEWQAGGQPQEGILILPANIGEAEAHAMWLDTWHTRDAMMVCEASRSAGLVSMMGTYRVQEGPDWGWRIELSQPDHDSLMVQMFNISPECEECLAVQMKCGRAT